MKPATETTDWDFKNEIYSNIHNEVTSYIPNDKTFKPLVEELHTEIIPITNLIEITLESLFFLKSNNLRQAYAFYYRHKEKKDLSYPAMCDLLTRLENLEHSINTMLALIARYQKYLPEIVKMENGEKQAKETWGKIPPKAIFVYEYDVLNYKPDNRLKLTIYKNEK